MSLVLTAGSAVVFMAGISLMLVGEAMRLEHPAGLKQVISLGAVVAAAGLALGLACAVLVLSAPQVPARSGSARAGSARESAEGNGYAVPDAAEEWLSPLRDAAARPVSATASETAAARGGPPGAGQASAVQEQAGYEHLGVQYSDEGWRLDATGPIPAPRPAYAPQEIHHPVRPIPAPRPPGQRPGADTGQFPACDTAELPPAHDTGAAHRRLGP